MSLCRKCEPGLIVICAVIKENRLPAVTKPQQYHAILVTVECVRSCHFTALNFRNWETLSNIFSFVRPFIVFGHYCWKSSSKITCQSTACALVLRNRHRRNWTCQPNICSQICSCAPRSSKIFQERPGGASLYLSSTPTHSSTQSPQALSFVSRLDNLFWFVSIFFRPLSPHSNVHLLITVPIALLRFL